MKAPNGVLRPAGIAGMGGAVRNLLTKQGNWGTT